jgi:hypothetical protein
MIDEIRVTGPDDNSTNRNPQPSVFIFGERHYSMVWIPGAEPRLDFADTWNPTDSEKVHSYDSLVVNSGTYALTESTLTTNPIAARVPGFMGGRAVYEYRRAGDRLWLTMVEEHSHNGIGNPFLDDHRVPLRLVRVE